MSLFEEKPGKRERLDVSKLSDAWTEQRGREDVTEALDYHDGNDIEHIEKKMAERFATELVKEKDPITGAEKVYVRKTLAAQKAAIRHGLLETVVYGMTRKVTGVVATLMENSEFSFIRDEEVDEEFKKDITKDRQDGSFDLKLGRIDEMSVLTGSAAGLVQVLGGKFDYPPIAADKIWMLFNDTIIQDDEERPTNKLEIEDAVCVIVQVDVEKFAAYYGRSAKHPDGRFVTYEGTTWEAIPDGDVVSDGDHTNDDGTMSNPLTVWQNTNKDYSTPEYPIFTWYGSPQSVGKDIMPISLSLYDVSKEIDLSASRTLMSANKNARGMIFFTNDAGASPNQPDSFDEGVNMLGAGQGALVLTVPSSNIDTAQKVNADVAANLANSYAVPPYHMPQSMGAIQVPSGTALFELNRPLNQQRQRRYKLNQSGMDRVFRIETALASIENGSTVSEGVVQRWSVLPPELHKQDIDLLNELKLKKELGTVDAAQIVVESNDDVEDREEAEKYLADLVPVVAPVPTNGLQRSRTIGTNQP